MTLDEWRADVQSRGGLVTWVSRADGQPVRAGVFVQANGERIVERAPFNIQVADNLVLRGEEIAIGLGRVVDFRDDALARVGEVAEQVAKPLAVAAILIVAVIAAVYIFAHKG